MLRLNLTAEPRWIDLGHGVRVLVDPLTSGRVAAANAHPLVAAIGPEQDFDVRWQAFIKAVGRICIKDWEGVGDDSGAPIPVSDAAVDALLDLYQIARAFSTAFISPTLLLAEEKKGFAPLPNGSSAGALNTAKTASHSATGASVN